VFKSKTKLELQKESRISLALFGIIIRHYVTFRG